MSAVSRPAPGPGPLRVVPPLVDDALQESFRAAMGSVAAAVAVVTTLRDGRPRGATVSAFASLSLDPPMLLVSLARTSSLLGALREGAAVGVNVLAAHQGPVATRFAQRRDDRFAGVAWSVVHGAPALDEHHAFVSLVVDRLVPAGDHVLVLGLVTSAAPGHPAAHLPLTYHRRAYGTHTAH